ncbi:hypothetical protein [Streptomyces sp. NPDC002324]
MSKILLKNSIFVTGDQTIDWCVNPSSDYESRSPDERLHVSVGLCWHKGGVFLLKSMIDQAIGGRGESCDCVCPDPKESDLKAYKTPYNHSFAILANFKKGESGPGECFRVQQFIGFRKNHETDRHSATPSRKARKSHRVIVIDDAALGFRNSEQNWRNAITKIGESNKNPPWIVLKMSHEVASGPLWDELSNRLRNEDDWIKDRLIVLVAAARLRDKGAEISRNLSWERSTNDVLTEINGRPELKDLALCRHLVISFGPSGALLLEQVENDPWTLIYNHNLMEGEWAAQHKAGMMFGYGSALCASLVSAVARFDGKSESMLDLRDAVRCGLVAMQRLYEQGFEAPGSTGDGANRRIEGEFKSPSGIFEGIEDHPLYERLSLATPAPDGGWNGNDRNSPPSLFSVDDRLNTHNAPLLEVSRRGEEALEKYLSHVPVATFGKLVTADQVEIESLHSIHNLIENYCNSGDLRKAKPLAVAVFGKPGSGKGFAIKQLVSPWTSDGIIDLRTFNLSQFNSASELVGALHEVRDIALSGRVPLAFWDEFDTPLDGTPMGWLRYFLAPIQDGKFQQAEATHLIGPAIFVFAGGTSENYESFKGKTRESAGINAKGADFLSRMRGYIDIYDVDSESPTRAPSRRTMLRRALILHSLFDKHEIAKKGDGYEVDDGILHALLAVPQYEHGARSMEAIIQMSKQGKVAALKRSSLPGQEQLNLHVNASNFLGIMRAHSNSKAA